VAGLGGKKFPKGLEALINGIGFTILGIKRNVKEKGQRTKADKKWGGTHCLKGIVRAQGLKFQNWVDNK